MFSTSQISIIEKKLIELKIDPEMVLKITGELAEEPKEDKPTKAKAIPGEKSMCISNTKSGQRCSKKAAKGEDKCSIHLKSSKKDEPAKSSTKTPSKEVKTPVISIEEKKKEIECLFGEDDVDSICSD